MELNQKTLRGILAQILLVDEKYIVPKQGNWWNPQEQINSPDTWCAYIIRSNRAVTAPFYKELDGKNCAVTEKIVTIDLQFVGPQSETIAQSITMWPLRQDVSEVLSKVQGSIMYTDAEAKSSNFYQSGNNNVVAWNTTIKILWYYILETTQSTWPQVTLNGTVKRL